MVLLNVYEPVQRFCRSFLAVCLPLTFCWLDYRVLQPSGSPQTVNEPTFSKAEKRFADLSRRRASALSDAKGTARWRKYLEVGRKVDPDSEETLAVLLNCSWSKRVVSQQ